MSEVTRIVLAVEDPETRSSMVVEVEETFDRVLNLCIPLQSPASALEARQTFTLTRADGGGRVFVRPENVALIEESRS